MTTPGERRGRPPKIVTSDAAARLVWETLRDFPTATVLAIDINDQGRIDEIGDKLNQAGMQVRVCQGCGSDGRSSAETYGFLRTDVSTERVSSGSANAEPPQQRIVHCG